MINPIASESEAINSATYVDNYIDSVENLPDDVQRQLSRIRDIDVQYRSLIRDVDHYYDLYVSQSSSPDAGRRSRSISRMHTSLIQAQELGDEKMQIVNHMQEIIDGKLRQLDTDQQNLDLKEERYASLLEDGQPTKLQRLQSPMREQGNQVGAGNGGLNGNGLITGKDHYGVCVLPGSSAIATGNGGSSTPNSERSSHVSNGGNSNSNGNLTSGGGDLQRTGSKRSRRRNESLVNNGGSSLEMGGNESNSANEASGSGGGGSGERKSSLGGGSAAGQGRKASLQAASGSLASGSASTSSAAAGGGGGNAASGSGAGVVGGANNSGKKKKRKVRGSGASNANASTREETPPPETIDPDEPTYCVCNQISFGEMILCDNDLCPIEWFHFSCVSLVLKPKGKWFCPNCRGERPNVMKPKAQFLKELERYNKEKEEKT
ncbi:inhibitor of growth protein 1 [Drosophila takahashii]|uniref:inhibitor of growth protein 1 n=1 Tax=Drosophila takahashii TaxID=29030 RepID=UPI001CF8F68A|nr:inhibitor of growth protein 1 [Drosophila takahashii]